MPGRFLTESERERHRRFPLDIPARDVTDYFMLSEADRRRVNRQRGDPNRLGFALQLCALRYLGFVPEELPTASSVVVTYLAEQLNIGPDRLPEYGQRLHTRQDHLQEVMAYLGFRKVTPTDWRRVRAWLVERALEHDKPTLLWQLACDKLRGEKIVRPGITNLERLVVRVRQDAQAETYRRLAPLLTDDRKGLLDQLLVSDEQLGRTPLTWLRQAATANAPKAILSALDKLAYLKQWTLGDLSALNPNRIKLLAQVGRRSTPRALQRAPDERRYPILLAFLHQSLVDITDEGLDMFDRCLAHAYARARGDLETFRTEVARATNDKVLLFQELARAVLDPEIHDQELRQVIFARVPADRLRHALVEAEEISRPLDDNYFDFLVNRYSYLRQFTPQFLETFSFRSNQEHDALLEAVALLRRLNAEGRRVLPAQVPTGFVPAKWRPYVSTTQGLTAQRHYYELCVLWELRSALRAGDVWLDGSRRYANPTSYLIPKDRWPELRSEVCQQIQFPEDSVIHLQERERELEALLGRVDQMLAQEGRVRLEHDDLVIAPLEAEDIPESAKVLAQQMDERLPHVELSDLLIEVDSWTGFSQGFEHIEGSTARSRELLRHQYACLVAQGCNIGLTKLAQIADLSYDRLAWCNTWYLREDTLKAAVATLVNFHYHQPLSRYWGGGTLSSSDGQRFPVSGRIRNATALPRYFGYGQGVTFYTWTSDQFSQYGTKVIPATVRDATYVLDEILDNETELSIMEHTTDTAGYTEIIFALFDLLGMQFAPRIRDVGDQRLYRLDRSKTYPTLDSLLTGKLNRALILTRWDDLLRVAGSLKLGWVTASLFIGKLQAYPRQNVLTRALQEYGRLIKTIFLLRYLESEEYRRRIHTQLNKGEALHALREFLFFANRGTLRRKQEEAQTNQAGCLNLLTNAVVAWNTVYMAAAIDQLRAEGYPVRDEDIVHLSPARFEHVNPYGKYMRIPRHSCH